MANSIYEAMFLLDSNRYARDPKGVATQIATMVDKCGGEVLVSRLWSEQKLAFPIKGHRKGTYWLTYFRMEGERLSTLHRESQLNSNVLRSLVLSIDERLADTLVKHAAGGESAAVKESSEEQTKEDEKERSKPRERPKQQSAGAAGP